MTNTMTTDLSSNPSKPEHLDLQAGLSPAATTGPPDHAGASTALTLDCEQFIDLLEDSGLNDEEKRDYIMAFWNLVVSFVDIGFGIHPVQTALSESCGQNDDDRLDKAEAVIPCSGSNHRREP